MNLSEIFPKRGGCVIDLPTYARLTGRDPLGILGSPAVAGPSGPATRPTSRKTATEKKTDQLLRRQRQLERDQLDRERQRLDQLDLRNFRSDLVTDRQNDTLTILFSGFIGDGSDPQEISERDFCAVLNRHSDAKRVILNVNSPGGLLRPALGMVNALLECEAETESRITSALSAGSLIALGCDKVRIYHNGSVMIHKAHLASCGDADHHADVADLLNREDRAIAEFFSKRTGNDVPTVLEWMHGGGFSMYGREAVTYGFASEVIPEPSNLRPIPKRPAEGRANTSNATALFQLMRANSAAARRQRTRASSS